MRHCASSEFWALVGPKCISTVFQEFSSTQRGKGLTGTLTTASAPSEMTILPMCFPARKKRIADGISAKENLWMGAMGFKCPAPIIWNNLDINLEEGVVG